MTALLSRAVSCWTVKGSLAYRPLKHASLVQTCGGLLGDTSGRELGGFLRIPASPKVHHPGARWSIARLAEERSRRQSIKSFRCVLDAAFNLPYAVVAVDIRLS